MNLAATCTDLEHVRRARRLLAILVDRFGVGHFIRTDAHGAGLLDERACDDAIALARIWIERRTGRDVEEDVARMMRKHLRRLLVERIRGGAACLR